MMVSLATAVPVVVEGNSLFGIEGLTLGGAGIWTGIAAAVIWWIRGAPERRRAANEHMTVSATAMAALVKHLTAEVERLGTLVTIQSSRITELEHKLAVTEGEVIRIKSANSGMGDARQNAALFIAAEKLDAKKEQQQ